MRGSNLTFIKRKFVVFVREIELSCLTWLPKVTKVFVLSKREKKRERERQDKMGVGGGKGRSLKEDQRKIGVT